MNITLITGANRGIGYEVARQLVAKDWQVVLAARKADAGRKAANNLGDSVKSLAWHVQM